MRKRESLTVSESLGVMIHAYKKIYPGKFSSFADEVLGNALRSHLKDHDPQAVIESIRLQKEKVIRNYEDELKKLDEEMFYVSEIQKAFQTYHSLKDEAVQILCKAGRSHPEWFAYNGYEKYSAWIKTSYAKQLLRDAEMNETEAYSMLSSVRTEQKDAAYSRIKLRRIFNSAVSEKEFEIWAENNQELLDECCFSAQQAYKFISARWNDA